jgi:putative nucleotidyltransferase with HDIG domain
MLLRRLRPDEVELGMFVHGFEGRWLDHPFWRTKFEISSERMLERVRAAGVAAVIIDEERGLPAPPPISLAPAAGDRPARPTVVPRRPPRRPAREAVAPQPCSVAREMGRATRLAGEGRRAVTKLFGDARLGKLSTAAPLVALVGDITDSLARNPDAFASVARLKSRHEYTYMHSVAVCALMINFARQLGLPEGAVREAGLAGLLHDVGKAVMPIELLDKPGRLADAEFETIRSHPERGYALLSECEAVPPAARDVCLHHHERIDGAGYPNRLAGRRLSLFARMGAICDVYDAITSERAYKDAWDPAESIGRMRSWTGQFDPELLDAFVKSIGIYPVGAFVRLADGRLAIVAGANRAEPMRPPVVALREEAGGLRLGDPIAPGACEIRSAVRPEGLDAAAVQRLRADAVRRAAR